MRATRGLGAWIAIALTAGVVASIAVDDGQPAESVVTADQHRGEVLPSATTSTPTTAAPTTTTAPVAVVESTTTTPPTTTPPTTDPPTTVPPEATPPTDPPLPDPHAVPAPPGFAIVLGPEVDADGLPYIHLRGTGCTGPDHTNGVPYTYPFEYGVSADFLALDGRQLLRTDPEHSQPGSGDWTSGFPPIEGAGEFLVTATCVGSNAQAEPNAGAWIDPILEYPAQRFTVPG